MLKDLEKLVCPHCRGALFAKDDSFSSDIIRAEGVTCPHNNCQKELFFKKKVIVRYDVSKDKGDIFNG